MRVALTSLWEEDGVGHGRLTLVSKRPDGSLQVERWQPFETERWNPSSPRIQFYAGGERLAVFTLDRVLYAEL